MEVAELNELLSSMGPVSITEKKALYALTPLSTILFEVLDPG